jgi:DNA-binding transcriptional ArsR family regulator
LRSGPIRSSVSVTVAHSLTGQVQAPPHRWTFITHHAQVLLAVTQKGDMRVREIASATGITERYAYRILRDLQNAGYVERRREGRCNLYRVNPDLALGDRLVEEHPLWELLRLIETADADEVVALVASIQRPVGASRRTA